MFAAFSLFWTTVPLLLASPAFGWSQRGIAAVCAAGARRALISPVAGRMADRGWTKPATGVALFLVIFSFAVAAFGAVFDSITLLVVAAILLDVGCILNLVLGQRAIYVLGPEIRSRLECVCTWRPHSLAALSAPPLPALSISTADGLRRPAAGAAFGGSHRFITAASSSPPRSA